MPLNIYRRPSGVFHIRGSHYGERIDRSSGARTEREARIIADKLEAEIFECFVKGPRAVCTFAEAACNYMRSGGEKRFIEPLLQHFQLRRLKDISQSDLDEFAARHLPTAKPASRLRMVYTPFIAIWNSAVADGKADSRVWRKPPPGAKRLDWRTPAEIEAILKECSPSLRAIVTCYVGSGARASELINLEWEQVSPAAQRIVFWEDSTKTGYARHVDLCERVRQALPLRGTGKVFRTEAGHTWTSPAGIGRALQRACARANVRHTSCHVLRHTWATWQHAIGRDIPWLMHHGGWSSVSMVMRYTHLGTDDLADAVKAAGWEDLGKPDIASAKTA